MRITDRWLKSVKPRDTSFDVSETGRRGFTIRVSPTGARVFRFRYKRDGVTRIWTIGEYPTFSLEQAHQAHQDARTLLSKGTDPVEHYAAQEAAAAAAKLAEFEAGTVGDLINEWYEHHALAKRKRPEAAKSLLDRNVPAKFREQKAKDIKRRQIIVLLDGVAKRSPAVANDVAALLKQIFSFGVDRDIITASPIVGLKAPGGEEKPRDRALTDDEVRLVWANLPKCEMSERVRLALKFILVTAQRRGETSLAKWSDISVQQIERVDGDGEKTHCPATIWIIPADHAKNGKEHLVPLPPLALAILEQLKALQKEGDPESPFLFPTHHSKQKEGSPMTERAITRAVRENEDKFGIPHFTPHDFRRTARTGLAKLKVPDNVAERVLNHTMPGMTAVYNKHEYLAEKLDALNKWSTHVQNLTSIK